VCCALLLACSDDDKSGVLNPAAQDASSGNPGAPDAGSGAPAASTDAAASIPADGASAAPNDAAQGTAPTDAAATPDAAAPADLCDTAKAPAVPGLSVQTVVPASLGLQRIVHAAQAPDSEAWYLVLQTGTIRKVVDGKLDPTPLLDVGSEARVNAPSAVAMDERGLLGLAFAPDFATSQLFYIFITPVAANEDEVREYKLEAGKAVLKRTLLKVPASAFNHNGGTLVFGPDGFLYVGTGDGGGGCNSSKPGAPQDPSSPYGKIMRLDPKVQTAPYAAAGNPYTEGPTVLHMGLRNPFRFSIDVPSRSLFIGDVGQDAYEELDVVSLDTPGKNFGWAAYEGTEMTCTGRTLAASVTWERPIFVADRRGAGRCAAGTKFCDWRSIIGGVVYRGSALPELRGVYVFGDYLGRRMVALTHCGGKTSDFTVINKVCDPNAPQEACLAGSNFTALTAIVADHQGELHLVADGSALLKIAPE
jgi:glucose/arabinose dehydrogenase